MGRKTQPKEPELPGLRLTRNGLTVTDSEGATGKRGTLVVGASTFYTIERGDRHKYLRPGPYECEMGYWTSSRGTKSEAIRVLGSYSQGRIYIHPANWPHQLEGCIAPGTSMLKDGVGNSQSAMAQIFRALGGFTEGQQLKLQVL